MRVLKINFTSIIYVLLVDTFLVINKGYLLTIK